MNFTNEIIAIARNIADDIRIKYGREASVIPNGVEIPVLAGTEEALKRFNLETQRYILSVGRFVPEKGFHDLINAFNNLKLER
jgi:glycosyltransferase involved in cell wall biosynthesis